MIIPPERGYEILISHRAREVQLAFGGKISGEQAHCRAFVWSVEPELETVTIKLVSDDGQESWYRQIALERAVFFFVDDFFAGTRFSTVLIIHFPDRTTLFLAEPVTSAY